jgi:hypothetical protein
MAIPALLAAALPYLAQAAPYLGAAAGGAALGGLASRGGVGDAIYLVSQVTAKTIPTIYATTATVYKIKLLVI